ncbi:MAG: glycosyltransferase family 4 protein, partial [Nitrososphaerota archaeon]
GFEVLEHGSVARALFAGFTSPMNRLCRVWLRDVDVIICVSRRQYEIVKFMLPELADKIKIVYNPPPAIPMVEKRLERPTFMYLGGESYVKGFHVFLKASWKLLERYPNVRFLLTQKFRDSTVSVIERLEKTYNLLGYLEYEEVLKLHSITHALLFPSIWEEPLPYVVMEAMLMGTIPIASKVGGVPEIVGETYAEKMLFEPRDVDEFVERMKYVLSMTQEELKDIGLSLREVALRRFDQEFVRNELVRAFLG